MLQRLRQLLVALAATVAVATTTVAVSAPASAEASTGCATPSVAGAVVVDSAYANFPWSKTTHLKVSATGTAANNCVSAFSLARYRYEVVVESTATTTVVLASGNQTYSSTSGATTISFPSATFVAPKGPGEMRVTIKAYVDQRLGAGWVPTGDNRTYRIDVPGSYDTANLAPEPGTFQCTQPIKPLGWTKWGGCEV